MTIDERTYLRLFCIISSSHSRNHIITHLTKQLGYSSGHKDQPVVRDAFN
ncbi:hypothetical protein WH47_12114 [Habropoda laboriosa]|uniref:Uncharacterized protein n=1 Tax=Habropoda laboriosa TaxID=597456 RepID=A0A0L7R1A2_9HYME|nr:hypothetical protein WH47_12114 [Habropoda laboriosa]